MASFDDEEGPPTWLTEVLPSVEGFDFVVCDKNDAYIFIEPKVE